MNDHIPDFYEPEKVGTLFYPDVRAISDDASRAALPKAADDARRIHLLIVDMQVDFCHEQGTLYVPGAEDDLRRLIAFIYKNADQLTDITCSLDSHLPHQIFHAAWWEDENGEAPPPMTVISSDEVANGKWRPKRMPEWSRAYVGKLEENAKKQLMIWPYHVPIGGPGNMLDPSLWSAVFWHAVARDSQPVMWWKGTIPETEHYSLFRPEIAPPGNPSRGEAAELFDLLESRDRIIVAGEAASHCVLETLEDLVDHFADKPERLEQVLVLRDCMSPIQHPEIDFAGITEKRFEEMEGMGVRFADSTEAPVR